MSVVDETVRSHCTGCYQFSPSHPTPDKHGPDADPKKLFQLQHKYILLTIQIYINALVRDVEPPIKDLVSSLCIQQTKWKKDKYSQLLAFNQSQL